MKKHLYFSLIILSMFLALTGCSNDDSGTSNPPTPPTPPVVIKGLTPLASAEPWFGEAEASQQLISDPQTMVVFFSLEDLPVECSTDDVSAAFVGDQCRFAVNVETYNDKLYGYVVMYQTVADGSASLSFNIRYYSEKAKGYFTSKPITYVTNETIGSLGQPAHLSWKLE